MEPLDDQGKACGLTEASIREAIMYPLSSSKIKVDRALAPAVFYVNVNTSYSKDRLCVSSVHMEARFYQNVTLKFSGDTMLVEINLWRDGGILFSPPSRHAAQITSGIEQYTKKFVTDWNLDNKPSTARN
jgi:hypothetical protein